MPRDTSHLRRGGPGRPKGSLNKIPGTVKASVRRAIEKIADTKPDLVEKAIERGLKGRPREAFAFVQLMAHYLDGKPAEKIEVDAPVPVTVINKFYGVEPSEVDD